MADELPEKVLLRAAALSATSGFGLSVDTLDDFARLAIEESNKELRSKLERAQAALLDEIEEFLEDHEDVLDGEDGPRPNRAMTLLRELKEYRALAIREAKEAK